MCNTPGALQHRRWIWKSEGELQRAALTLAAAGGDAQEAALGKDEGVALGFADPSAEIQNFLTPIWDFWGLLGREQQLVGAQEAAVRGCAESHGRW